MDSSNGILISSQNQGPLLNIVNWILLTVTCTVCLLKIISKYIMVRQMQQDDAYMAAAMVSGLPPLSDEKSM